MSDPTEVIAAAITVEPWDDPTDARDLAVEALAALRADGWHLYRPEECETQQVEELDHEAGPQWMWPSPFAPVPAGTYRLVPVSEGTEQ